METGKYIKEGDYIYLLKKLEDGTYEVILVLKNG